MITKHALSPSYKEVQSNKPSRSARLRAFRFT
ncbi:16S rRNA (cytosine(1402)-N(4))-methyltransferase [Patescibacteria group bacterium]|nr:16S rRNA (cytosine(1402)-N(4))-methyltransferase [Patescibacteria group bacterium]